MPVAVEEPSWPVARIERAARNPCAREGALSARCKSAPWGSRPTKLKETAFAVRRGGEQPEANWRSVGERT